MRRMGTVVAIEVENGGSYVNGDVLAGETILPILDMGAFREEGGSANIGGTVTGGELVDGVEVTYTAAVDDIGGDYLILTDPLADDVPDRTDVFVSPLVQYKTAMVDIGDGEVYDCDVPSDSRWSDARLAETATGGQTVLVEREPGPAGLWTVVRPIGSAPSIDGTFIKPGTALSSVVDADDPGWAPLIAGFVGGGVDGGTW